MQANVLLASLERKKQYKFPFILLGVYVTFLLATVCLANKITQVGPLLEPGGIFVFVFTFVICDIVGEVYGYAYPRLFIWIGVMTELLFAIVVTSVSHLSSPEYFKFSEAYPAVFDPTLRYVCSSLIGLLFGEFTNVYLLAKWKIRLRGKYFILRSLVSTAFGQACITIIVDILNYTGSMSVSDLMVLMCSGYLWKMSFSLLLVFPAWLLVRYLKKAENIDYFDLHTNFNPFMLAIREESSQENVLKLHPDFNQ